MSDGRILKPDKDFSQEVDKQIPEAQELAQVVGLFPLATESLLIYSLRVTFKQQSKNSRYWKNLLDRFALTAPTQDALFAEDFCSRLQIFRRLQDSWSPSLRYVKTREIGAC